MCFLLDLTGYCVRGRRPGKTAVNLHNVHSSSLKKNIEGFWGISRNIILCFNLLCSWWMTDTSRKWLSRKNYNFLDSNKNNMSHMTALLTTSTTNNSLWQDQSWETDHQLRLESLQVSSNCTRVGTKYILSTFYSFFPIQLGQVKD